MLHRIRPCCGLIIYLLLVSYVAIICKQPLSNLYHVVVYNASVFHYNANLWNQSAAHDHGQEITFSELEALLSEAQTEQEQQQEDHTASDLPKKKLKYFNPLAYNLFELLSLDKRNYSFPIFKSDLFQIVEAPPPKA